MQEYNGVLILSTDMVVDMEGFLYVGKTSVLMEKHLSLSRSGFILVDDIGNFNIDLMNTSTVILDRNTDLQGLVGELSQIFLRWAKHNQVSDTLLNFLGAGQGIEALMNKCAQLLENPILLVSESRAIIAVAYPPGISGDEAALQTLSKGFVSDSAFREAFEKKISIKIHQSNEPIISDYYPMRRIFSRIMAKNTTLAYISVIEATKAFEEKDLALVSRISDVLAIELQKDPLALKTDVQKATDVLVYDILEKRTVDPLQMNRWLSSNNWRAPYNLYAVHISTSVALEESELVYKTLEGIACELNNATSWIKAVRYRKTVVCVLNAADTDVWQEVAAQMEEQLTAFDCMAGISSVFHDLNELRMYLGQAKSALRWGDLTWGDRRLYAYKDIVWADMLANLRPAISYQRYYFKNLERLSQYDFKNGTQYYQTLKIYIKYGMSKSKTAEALFIHRNTLKYRLEAISRILNLDIDDPSNIPLLTISFTIDKIKDSLEV